MVFIYAEKAFLHLEKGFLYVEKTCDVISLGLAIPKQDCVRIPKTHFRPEIRDLYFGLTLRTLSTAYEREHLPFQKCLSLSPMRVTVLQKV